MATEVLDCQGLKCPQPILKMSAVSAKMSPGDMLEVIGDCPTFEKDVNKWCARMKKTLLFCRDDGGSKKTVQIKI